jgi:Leucine-rich repeat (LRR) protein
MSKDGTCHWYETLTTTSGLVANFGVTCDVQGHVTGLLMPGISMKGIMPPEIGLLTSMVFFQMYSNKNVTGTIEWIGELTKLNKLALYDNQLTSTIPSSVRHLSDLEVLELGTNALTGPIPEWIGELTKLNMLALYDNQLTSMIPSSLSNLKILRFLALDGSLLTGDIGVLENLTNLWYLYLEHNMLSQSIDETTLKKLTMLEQ